MSGLVVSSFLWESSEFVLSFVVDRSKLANFLEQILNSTVVIILERKSNKYC